MNYKTRKNLTEWFLMLSAAAVLYFSGWHTEVIGKVQQGVLLSGLFTPDTEERAETAAKIPEADFNLKLRNQEGKVVNMEDLKGKVIFINFWATWCPPCIAEMPGIDALSEDLKGEDVAFLMISLDDNFEKAKNFRKKKGYSFDVHQPAARIPEMYYSQSIPATFVISAEGKLVYSHKGMADYNTKKFKTFLRQQQQ